MNTNTDTTRTVHPICYKLVGSWKCQKAKGHAGRHGTIPDSVKAEWAK